MFFFKSSGGAVAYGEKQEQRQNRSLRRKEGPEANATGTAAGKAAAEPLRTEKEYSLNIRTMKELLKLWKADCEAEGFSKKDYIIVAQAVVLFSIFLAIL